LSSLSCSFLEVLFTQLSAGSGNVQPLGFPDRTEDSFGEEILLEAAHILGFGALELGARIGVEVDEVHLGPDAVEKPHQLLRRPQVVVDILDDKIFEEHLLPLVDREVADRLHDGGDVVGFVDGHELLTHSSSTACSEIARLTPNSIAPSFSMRELRPEVEIV